MFVLFQICSDTLIQLKGEALQLSPIAPSGFEKKAAVLAGIAEASERSAELLRSSEERRAERERRMMVLMEAESWVIATQAMVDAHTKVLAAVGEVAQQTCKKVQYLSITLT